MLTAVTRGVGWNGYRHKSQHGKLTQQDVAKIARSVSGVCVRFQYLNTWLTTGSAPKRPSLFGVAGVEGEGENGGGGGGGWLGGGDGGGGGGHSAQRCSLVCLVRGDETESQR